LAIKWATQASQSFHPPALSDGEHSILRLPMQQIPRISVQYKQA
jgi:hypothetical protein